ncbi:hypothetical protein [Allochromatium vinosum]|uniref:Uncharacterized protein n=1 Tax=Allochromatium vinosum (strain ATCC 17899 / DSM 180 / NBRC 103801 / NCIMB 10441 / D) TaxID=572477 RepID=D3RN98_ALLVD|nr:hypothetical protein [Allochromatium vinosum]ADC61382.1 conserved hypothetical protein [Allochromatium vinosum DSM 180]MBK1654731.1 hypothetical protein [Allochromatium vinosum]
MRRHGSEAFIGLILLGLLVCAPAPAAPERSWEPGLATESGTCIWTAPLEPRPGQPLEVFAVSTDGALERLNLTDPAGQTRPLRTLAQGGPPWSLYGTVFRPERGTYRLEAMRHGQVVARTEITIGNGMSDRGSGRWDLATEALYAAWIEHLFNAPPEQALTFESLTPVLSDPAQNFLFGYLGANEDNSLRSEPDCADLPYYLRAYFAWKLGLPISYRACNRGSRSRPPRCESPIVDTRFVGTRAPIGTFREATRRLVDTVHSGSARTGLRDEATDVYPVALSRETLWPGTLYADPYGHVLILVKWLPGDGRTAGRLLAVDAQPDNSVARKRYWEGNFLFAQTASAGPGFKVFRPLEPKGAGWRLASNAELDGRSGRPAFSLEQADLDSDSFHARVARIIDPRGLDPVRAYDSVLEALMEQLETRVTSVDTGERYMREHPGAVVPMPSGPAIFETVGPWEDYATPSRDMRLLIALKVVEGLPERIRRHPELYALAGEDTASAADRVARLHEQRLDARTITYTRSDGSPWRLSLRELYARRANLEVGYNPNDCVEIRWGATPGSAEAATCGRRAPSDQQTRMESYRAWFRDTTRPPR